MRRFCSIFFLILTASCANKTAKVALNDDSVKSQLNKIIITELDSTNQLFYNNSQTYVLAIQELTEANARNRVKYIIINTSSLEIAKKGSFTPGHLKWISDTSLELLSVPGTIPQGKNLSDYSTILSLPLTN